MYLLRILMERYYTNYRLTIVQENIGKLIIQDVQFQLKYRLWQIVCRVLK